MGEGILHADSSDRHPRRGGRQARRVVADELLTDVQVRLSTDLDQRLKCDRRHCGAFGIPVVADFDYQRACR